MDNLERLYSLTNGKYVEELASVDNLFIRQLATLSAENAKQAKMVSVVLRDKANNRGEISQRGVRPDDKSIIDVCKLTPLAGFNGSRNLLEEIASYRAMRLNFNNVSPTFWRDNKEMLLIDYLLSACLCYVEVFDSTNRVDKFFATRNRFVAGMLAGMDTNETAKYMNYLQTYPENYQTKQIKVLKLALNKSGVRITQPRSFLDLNKSVKVTPLFLMSTFVQGIQKVLEEKLLKFTYIKDNLTEREFVTTLSTPILFEYYEKDVVLKMMSNMRSVLERGYVRLPEVGISKYDASGVRALNISRITSIEEVQGIDARYINVDFNLILPTFKECISRIKDINALTYIYSEMTGKQPQTTKVLDLRDMVINFVDSQYAVGTTQALRYIHDYMMSRKQFFPLYNGGVPVQFDGMGTDFNLGIADQ